MALRVTNVFTVPHKMRTIIRLSKGPRERVGGMAESPRYENQGLAAVLRILSFQSSSDSGRIDELRAEDDDRLMGTLPQPVEDGVESSAKRAKPIDKISFALGAVAREERFRGEGSDAGLLQGREFLTMQGLPNNVVAYTRLNAALVPRIPFEHPEITILD